MVTAGRKSHQTQVLKTALGLGKSDLVGKNVWGKGVSQEDACKHFPPETRSAQLYDVQLSPGPHRGTARDVRATGIRCPSKCLQKSRSHLNSRNEEFTRRIHPRTENDIISLSLATLPSRFRQWLQLSSHFLCACSPSSHLIWFEVG